MLTKQDLTDVSKLLKNEFKIQLQPIYDKLIEHDKQFEKIQDKLSEHDKQFKTVNKKLNKLQKDLDVTIDFFDDYRIKHKDRLEMIESHLGLPTPSYT